MKKNLLFFLLLCIGALTLPTPANAQLDLTVADGTSPNQFVPIYGFYADAYLRCQVVYPAADLADMTGGTITSLTYYLYQPADAAWTGTWEVKLMEITASSLSDFVDMTNATTVYTGALDGTSSTMTITFTTPYTYQGGNLLIEVSETATGNYKSAQFYGVTAGTGVSLQGYSYSGWSSISATDREFIPKTTFTYLPGGSGPMCFDPTGLTSSATASEATISWNAPAAGDSPQGYQVCCLPSADAFDAATATWTAATGTSHTFAGLTSGTAYTAHVRSVCGTNFYSNGNASVEFTPGICAYTFDLDDSFGDGWNGNEIEVSVNGNLLTTLTISSGSSYTTNVMLPDGGNLELAWVEGNYSSEASFTVTDPFGMQLYACTNGSTLTDGDVFYSGTVSCTPITCFPPTGLHASVTTNEATIGWDEVAENHIGYQAEWNGSVLPGMSGNPFSFTGLTPGGSYSVRVRTICAAGDTSAWSNVYTFHTYCNPITTFPYIQGFEDGDIPACWGTIDGDGDGYNWYILPSPAMPHTGTNNIASVSYYYDEDSEIEEALTPNNWLISPSFTLPTPCNLSLVWYAQSMAFNWPDPLDVLLSTTGRDTAAFTTTILSLDTVPSVYTQYTYSLANYAGQTVTFAFVHRNVTDMLGVNLDDVGIVETPEVVTNDATAIATTTATLNGFVNGNNLLAYGFEWKTAADADYIVDTLSTGTQTGAIGFNLANLTPNTTYTFRTFANDANGFVFYGDEKTFTTEQLPCPAPANLEVADIYYISATLNWVSQLPTVGSYNVYLNNTLLTATPISALTYPLTGLNSNSDYEVRVTTVCDDEEGASATATFSTPCLAPTTVDIGEGTTSVNYIPVNNYYSYTYSQQIYTATELGGAKDINSISFQYANSLASTNKNNVDIYLGHTTKESFTSTTDYIPVADLTLVYSGNLNCTQGWNTFELTTPFPYNGTDNLVVAVDDNSGAYNDYSYNFYVHTANSNMTLHYRSDSNNPDITSDLSSYTGNLTTYRNNIKFGYCDPNVTCIPPTIDSVTHITANSAVVHWTQGFQEDAWVLQYMGDTDDDWTTVTLTPNSTNPYSLPNLTSNTGYTVRMWSICGNDLSDTTQTTFTTPVSCPAPTSPVISNVTANSVSFSWTPGGNESEWDVYYSWQSTTDPTLTEGSITYTVTATSYTFTGLNPNTTYTAHVRAVCGDNDVSDYAEASFTTLCGTETMPWSENFDNWTSKSTCWSFLSGAFSGTPTVASWAWTLNSSYGDYITISGKALTMNVFSTNNYWAVTPPINITSNTAMLNVDVAVSAWSSATTNYDANDTLAFAITTDNGTTYTTLQVFNNTELNALDNAYTTLSVPVSGYNGQTVRFAIFAGSAASGGDNRIVIDNVSVDEAPSCPVPTGVTVASMTATTATLTWTPGGNESAWDIYGPSTSADVPGVNPDNMYSITATSYTVTNLPSNSICTLYVRANCGNEKSNWVSKTFTTPCGTINVPYTENFDSYSSNGYPTCWSRYPNYSNTTYPYLNPNNPYSGINSLYFYSGTSSSYMAILPELSLGPDTAMSDLWVTFYYSFNPAYNSSNGKMIVGVMEVPTDPASFTPVDTVQHTATTTWEFQKVRLTNYNGNGKYIAFKNLTTASYAGYFIDDVTVEMMPSCIEPENLAVSAVTSTSTTLTWTPGNTETSWEVGYVQSDVEPVAIPTNWESTTTPSYTFTNLTPRTTYTAYVRSNCGNDGMSDPVSFNFTAGTYNMHSSGWDTLRTCDMVIYDNGGANGDYSANCNSYLVIFPDVPGKLAQVSGSLDGEAGYDYLIIYDGVGTDNILLDLSEEEDDISNISPITSTTGPLTIYFQSDNSGQYEGFELTVSCVDAPSCLVTSTPTASDVTVDGATLTWTSNGNETQWDLYVADVTVDPTDEPSANSNPTYTVQNNPHTLTGLTTAHIYKAYVRANCGNDGVSEWSAPATFVPGSYNMGSVRTITTCSAIIYDDGGVDGNYSSYRNDTLTIYPAVQGNLVQVSGSISVEGSSWDYLNIYDGAGTTDLLLHDNSIVRPHTIQTIISTTGPLTLYFHSDSGTEYAGLELNVTCVPPCEAPNEVVGTTISNNQSDLTFGYDQQAQGINLELQYKATDATNWSSSILVQDISYTLTGLDNNTTYDVRVRSVCGNADAPYYSEWVTGTLDVACPAPTIPDASYYDYDATTIMLSWDNTGAPTFNVMRVEGNNTTIIDMQYEDDPENYFADDLTPNTTYTFYVRSICNNGTDTSAWSNAITFTTPETCPTPTGLTASDETTNSATLTWTATGTPDGFEVEYGPVGFVHGDGSTVTVPAVATTSTQTTPLTNLTSNTSYEVYVRAVCGNDHSDWSLVASFTTLCDAVTLPYTETFESNSSAINCWSTEGPGSWTIGTGDYYTSAGSYQGTQNALIKHGTTNNVTKFISPVLDDVQNGLRLDFAYLMRRWSNDIDELRVYSRSAAGGTWQLQATYTDETVTWTTESITIPGAVYQVAFEHTDKYGFGLGIDSVVFTPMSADFCYAVTNLAADSVTARTARISWVGNANTYTILNMADGSVVTTQADTTYKFTNLTPETQYTFGVVANCTSSNSDTVTVTFTTLISCPAPTGLTAEIVETDGIMFSVNGGGNAEGYQVEYGETGFAQGQGTIVYEPADATSQTIILIDGLTANTSYDFYVRAICGVGDTSAWSGVTTEATACGAITLPYTETFESTSGTRDCWALVASANIGGSNGMGFVTVNGRQTLRFSSFSSASDYNQYGFSPLMNVSSSATNLKVKVTYATYGSSDILNFGYVTSTDTVWDSADYTTNGNSDWQTAEFIIPATATQVAIHYYGSWSYYGWIDTVAVTELTGEYCYAVTNLAVDSVTARTARISWVGNANTYTIINMADGSVVTTQADTTYKLTNLTPETQYTFGVVANCTSSNSDAVYVTFTTPISCPAPTGLTAEIVEADGIMFSVNGGGNAEGYQVEYGETGFAQGQGTIVYESADATSQTLIAIDNLNANTVYDFYVRAICGVGDTSAWSPVITESTACDAASVPYTENFNSYTGTISTSTTTPTGYPAVEMPSCWNFLNRSTSSYRYPQAFLTSYSNYAVDGNCLFFASSSATPLYAVLPLMSEDIDNLQVTFTYLNEGTNSSNGTLHVGYMTDPMDANTYVDVYTCEQTTTKTEKTVRYNTVTPSQNTTYYIAFKYEGGSANKYYLGIDDVTVDLIPSCPAPTGLTAELVETTEIMFSVNGGGNAEGYQVEYGETGFAQGQGTIVYEQANVTSQTLIVVDGLSAATVYDFYVRAICGAGDTSAWSGVTTETTACDVISTFPYTENFDAVAIGTLPVCWTNTRVAGLNDWKVVTPTSNPSGAHSSSNAVQFKTSVRGNEATLQMPTFNLTSLATPMLSFWYTNKKWSNDQDTLKIYYRTSTSGSWNLLATYSDNVDSWTKDSVLLPNPSTTYQILFKGISRYGYGIHMDDIVVKEMPVAGCFAPTDVAVSNETYNSADVSWTDAANYTYELQYREANAGLQQVDTTITATALAAANNLSNGDSIRSGIIDANISYTGIKNDCSNPPKYYNNGENIRLYSNTDGNGNGNSIKLTPSNGAVITGLDITTSTSNTPTVSYSVDGGTSAEATRNGLVYTISGISATTSLEFQNTNTNSSNTQLRVTQMTVHYTLPGTESTWTAIVPATSPTTLDNLTPETDYEVRVRTICAAGDTSDWTNAVPFSTEEFICPVPVKMSVDNITMNSADVIWSDNGTYPTELQYKLPDTPAQSVDTTITVAALAAANNLSNGDNIGSGTIDAYISYSSTQNSASNAPKYYTANEAIHFYYGSNGSGNSMTLIPSNGVVITSLELTTSSNNNTPTVNYSVDGGTPVTATRSGQVYTISNISASSSLKFQNANTSNTQLRITQLKIQYTIPGTAGSWISMANVTSPVQLTGLTPNTTYSVRLRNICAAGDTSVWESTEFTTLNCATAASDTFATACNSFTWKGTTYTATGEYTHTIPLANGCDSVVTLHLTINEPVRDTITAVACNSYTWDGTSYNASGDYEKTYSAANGCDSIVTLRLTINIPQNTSTTVVACGEYTWTEGTGQTYTVSGPYYFSHMDANGCTQVDTLRLTVQPATNVSILATQTDILLHESVTLTASGAAQYAWNTYEQTATITVTPTAMGNYTYIVTGTNVLGTCPSSDTITIHVDECMPARSTETVVACDSFTWHGTTYTQSMNTPTYTIPNGAASGCDSIITLNLTINHTVTNTITEVACDSFVWDGTKYTASGIYEKTYTAANNCDSVVTLNLTINNTVTNSVTAVACDSFVWDGTTYTASGDYVKTYTAANNCDSVVTLHLTINFPSNVAITETACGSYTWVDNNNTVYTESGTYTYSHTDQNGCTQVDTLYLTINAIPTVTVNGDDAIALYESATLTASGADSYTWNTGDQTATITVTPTAIGTAIYTVVGTTNNCVSEPATFNVVVGRCRPATYVETIVACDSYTWHGTTYTASTDTATYTVVDGAASGCDSIVTLHLTINNSVTNAINEVACDSYTWDGTTYTTSGNYVKTYTAANGCDSTVTLTLTINNSVTNTITEVACDSYTWNDSLYTESGDYVQTLQTAAGCDSVVTLHLTVNSSVTSEFTENVCGSYTWNNVNYTQSGNFTQIFTAANGCDSTVTLHLTVRPIPQVYVTGNTAISRYQSTTLTAHGADNYLWNNQATTAAITVTPLNSASYSVIGTTDGCSSAPAIVTVYVGDCIPAQGAETVSACESYVWHGVTYTHNTTLANAPTYTIRGGAANGCDSVVSLVLTIYTPAHTATTLTECNSYNWHGTVYTESGTYTYAHPDAHGCTQVDTLHLNIIKPQNLAYEVSSCGTYYWHNQPRRRTGTYMYTYADENGCSKTDTLYLTVYNPVHQSYTVTACDNYEWFGHSYNRTGTYIYTHSDEHGCEQVDTLHLTINHSVATEITETGCGSYTWNDSVYTQNGNYTQTFTTASGCDSVVTLHLTLYPVVTMNSITGDTLIHEYESATLVAHATGATSYEWVDASTSQVVGTTASITVSPMTTTTYSVVASNGHCASPSTSVTVRVLPCIPAQGVEDVTACGSYEWHGVTYTQSTNTPTFTINRQGMCDSVVTLNLTINNPVANELTLVECNAYTWNNVEYTTSGDYTQTFTAANGCDSVVTLHLTINNSVVNEFSATGCGQYTWDNTTYNQSGDYVKTFTAANGCDSVVTLHLTIYPMPVITSVTGNTNIHEYESTTLTANGVNVAEYTWVGQGVGQTLTVSPMQTTTYTVIGTSADQCVSTEYVVTVHVLPCIPAQGVENVTACGSYEWHGVTYTQSTSTPTFTYERQGMCDSVVTLHLTINTPVATEFAVVNCNAYTWNNVEYVESGDYTQTFTAANGCDSVVTLHLTINNSMATEFSDTGCGQYVWDNTVYTQSGNYVKQYTTANGCDSVVTLHLTIYPIAVIASVSGNTVIREYESTTLTANGVNVAEYTWVGQGVGQTITVSPMQTTTYTVIGTSANNCASAEYQVTVHVLPCVPVQSVENVTACGAYEWHGVTYTQSTNTPTFTYERQGMCDSVVTLHLTIYNPQNSSMNAQTCDGSYEWNGTTYTQSGTYTYEHQDNHGCTVVDTLRLTIMTPQHASLTASACSSYWWNGQNYTQSGTYTYSFVNQNGCTQVDTLHLTINQPAVSEFTAVACEEYAWGNSVYNHSGDYVKHFTTVNGCDSMVTLHLTINNPVYMEFTATACGNYNWNNVFYAQSGDYTQTFTMVNGCDSVVTLHLTINNPQPRTYTAFNCGSYTWNGMTFVQSGTYTYEHPDQNGCTQVDTLHLTIGYPVATEFNATGCESYTWNNQTYHASGTYMQTLHTVDGCDSVVTLHLTIFTPDLTVVNETACDSYTWNGQTYTQSGRYTANLHNVNGCDSMVVLNLTINNSIEQDVYETACGSYAWNNVFYAQSGTYTQTFTAANGCDSVVTLHLTVNNPTHQATTVSECGAYLWNNTLYTQSGTYTFAHLDQNGCMQVDTLHLTIYNPVNEIFTVNACDSYTWFGTTYTQSGVYTHQHADAHGCMQIDTLNLTIYSTAPVTINVDACGTYIWHGMLYAQSGTYTYRYFNNAGCEQTEVLHLTVHTPQHQAVTVSECGSYLWNNTVYTQSGTYTFAHFDNNGCTQVDTLHLTIYTPQHTAVTVTECNAYTWHNTLYTQSGTYTYAHTDNHGCTQVDTLHLTILPTPAGHVVTVSECGSYTWYGQTHTQSGTYYHNFTDNNGCVGVDTLHLTIYTPQHTAVTVVECGSYIWNNTLYMQSGTYTYAHLDQNGCTQVDTLHLTLGHSQNVDLTVTECGSYTWHGQTYTQSGTYTYTQNGTAGCIHTETLHLIIFHPQHESFTAGDCNSYTWHGQTYTQSGTYYYSHLDANGCTQVDTLHLTIYGSQPQTFNVSECESYTWHGTTYTQSGTYTYTTYTVNGCEQIETLHLTIHNPVHQSYTAEDCEYYTWHGVTYGQSGVYTYAHVDNFGCMQVDTLHLTIHQPQHYDFHVADPGSSYTWNGVVYGQSGTYTQVFTDQFGCDSTVVLHLSLHTIGVEEYTLDNDVTVYPNPTRNRVTIGTTNLSVEKLDIYDAYGKLLATINVNDADAEVDLSTYAAGTYFIRITTDKGVVTKRVVKQQ